jgi:putative DNA primase/helicase
MGENGGMTDPRIIELASLSALEYEHGFSLREVEVWPESVDGDALLDSITQAVRRYLVLPPNGAEVIALWAVAAHAFNGFQISPRLHVRSPEKRCGKTIALDVLECLTPRSIRTENVTTAVLFRLVDGYRPTLLIDEVDAFLKDYEELRGALNAGHRRGGQMLRCEGDHNEVRAFKTFAPVALAGIGRLPGTLEDRSIAIEMRRRKPTEQVARFRRDRANDLDELASMAARWVADHEVSLSAADPEAPGTLHDRAVDNWRPLFAIADLAGGEWPTLARQVAVRLSGGEAEQDASVRVQLLVDVKVIFDADDRDQLPSVFICGQLADMEDRPWPEWRQGKPITARQLARQLEAFSIRPGTIRTESPISIRHNGEDVADEKTPKPAASLDCGGVAAKNGESGDERCFEVEDDPEERRAIQEWDGEVTP